MGVYRRRQPERSVAYRAVQQWLSMWLWQADAVEPGAAPAYVERELRGYLECGILAHGFARARCEDCAANFLDTDGRIDEPVA